MAYEMNPSATHIHQALETVALLRQQRAAFPALVAANAAIKRFQAKRFEATYPDLLQSPRYQAAARFFLYELYSAKDYGERDQQFARIVSTIATLFPQSVVKTAAALAQVHTLTEQLDDAMARVYVALQASEPDQSEAARYIGCWRQVANLAARRQQLEMVVALGKSLDSLTHKLGLRTLLKVMRGPAAAAGLGSLQLFLEAGFDAFQTMHGADEFLTRISMRETDWMVWLFEEDAALCESRLTGLLAEKIIV